MKIEAELLDEERITLRVIKDGREFSLWIHCDPKGLARFKRDAEKFLRGDLV